MERVSKKYTFWLMTEFVRECRKKRAEHGVFPAFFMPGECPLFRRHALAGRTYFSEKGSRRRRKGKGMSCGRAPGASVLFVYPRSQWEEKEPDQAVSGGGDLSVRRVRQSAFSRVPAADGPGKGRPPGGGRKSQPRLLLCRISSEKERCLTGKATGKGGGTILR